MLGDVGHPQLVAAGPGELALDQVAGGRLGSQPASELGAAGDALQAGAAHQQLHSMEADRDAPTQGELGVDPSAAVGLAGGSMDLSDHLGEPGRRIDRGEGGRLRQA
jgi:hypothetical protein